MAVVSAGPYGSLHLARDRQPRPTAPAPQPLSFFCRPDALPANYSMLAGYNCEQEIARCWMASHARLSQSHHSHNCEHCLTAGLASHWPCISTGSRFKERRRAHSSWSMAHLTFTFLTIGVKALKAQSRSTHQITNAATTHRGPVRIIILFHHRPESLATAQRVLRAE